MHEINKIDMNTVTLRPVCVTDAAQVVEIYNFYVEHSTATMEITPISVAEMTRRIEEITTKGWFVAAEQAGKILGYAYAKPWHDRVGVRFTFESSIYLAPEYCGGQDLGRIIYGELVAKAQQSGRVAVLLGVITSENEASKRFHEKMGFSYAATLENVCFKSGRWLGMVFYRLDFALGADVS